MIKLDIENKILIPFMVLIALCIALLGLISYWNGYKLLLDNQRQQQRHSMMEVLYHLKSVDVEDDEDRREAVSYLDGYHRQGLYVFDEAQVWVNHLPVASKVVTAEVVTEKINRDLISGKYEDDALMITYAKDEGSGWIVAIAGEKKFFVGELVDAQKYSILVAIILLILSMQATILIAHHLSRPVRYLAEQCNQMSAGDLDTQLKMDRNDEIGMLAESFNQMIHRLQENTKKMQEAKQFNEDVLRSLTTGVLVMGKDGLVLNQNESAMRLLDPDLTEVGSDKPFMTLLQEHLTGLLDKSNRIDRVYVLKTLQSIEKRYYAISVAQLINSSGEMIGAIFSFADISERKRLEMRMERVNRMAYVGQLASGLAHEIRNPLAGMKTSIQVLKRRLVREEEDRNGLLFDNVVYEIDRMNKLVSELLDFAKPHRPDLRRLNLIPVVERTLSLVATVAEERMIKLAFESEEGSVEIMADENQTEQVLLNVITNAINASSEEDTIKLRLMSHQDASGTADAGSGILGSFRVHFVVEDEGMGIADYNLEKVFDPFFTTHASGTGLGLSVVQKLMTDMGGEIELISKEGVGTTVILKFPIAQEEEAFG